ncbi:MAG: hypothetical protein M1524_01895 [Patescibacteria group bacterium]|nr:hypothetical protein [Patescibacteria group bacterium]
MKIKIPVTDTYQWIKLNIVKIMFTVFVYAVLAYVVNRPYLNIVRIAVSDLPFLVSYIVALILFRPKKESLLKIALYLLIPGFIFSSLRVEKITNPLGIFIYLMIATYLIFSLKEIKIKK